MTIELDMWNYPLHRIMTEKLSLKKVCARFVSYKLTDDHKVVWLQHHNDLTKESKMDLNFKYSIVTDDETWSSQYDPKRKRQSAEFKNLSEPEPKKAEASKVKTYFICFHVSKGKVRIEFMPQGQRINGPYYLV